MLKLEPREAAEIILPSMAARDAMPLRMIDEALATMRAWRHYGA